MGIVVFWLIMAGVVAMIASSKGKSGGAWFFYGALIWPIALVHILVTPGDAKAAETREITAGGKKCPRCAEIIKRDALVCRFCGSEDLPSVAPVRRDHRGLEMREYSSWEKLWWKPQPPDDR